jgi:FtsH-binding integral membrane protein
MSKTNSPIPIAAASFAAGIASLFFYNQFKDNVTNSRSSRRRSEIDAILPDWLLVNSPTLSVSLANHLTRVYATLGAAVLAAAGGSLIQMRVGGSTMMAQLVSLGLAFSLSSKATLWKLLGFGFFQGMSLGNALKFSIAIDSTIVPLSLGSSAAILLSFAAGATMATRRSLLYLYGSLGSALSVLTLSSLANLYFRSSTLFNVQLWGGLAMFIGYVAADSQLIIELADQGDTNYVYHAWMLFTDLAGIFVRMLYMFTENALQQKLKKKKKQDEEGDDNNDGRRR